MCYVNVRSISENGRQRIFCTLFVSTCRKSCISFRITKPFFTTFPFETHFTCEYNKRVSKSELLSLHKSASRRKLSTFALMRFRLNHVVQNTFQLIRYGFYHHCLTMSSAVCTNHIRKLFFNKGLKTGTATKHRCSAVGAHANNMFPPDYMHLKKSVHFVKYFPCSCFVLSVLQNKNSSSRFLLGLYTVHNVQKREVALI